MDASVGAGAVKTMKRSGFVLLELLVVACIIAILAAILFPVFARAREKARATNCQSNLRQMGIAMRVYAQDNYGHFPPRNNDLGPLYPHLREREVFKCPSLHYRAVAELDSGRLNANSYLYKAGFATDDLGVIPLARDSYRERHSEGANTLFVDGHVKWLKGTIVDDWRLGTVPARTQARPGSPPPAGAPSAPGGAIGGGPPTRGMP